MSPDMLSGQAPFAFAHRGDLSHLPAAAGEYEVHLHGGFAVDGRAGFGQIYYGMPGCGLMRIEADLSLEGKVEFVLPRPVFEEYQDRALPYAPTDTVLVGKQLFIADGYGSNYIS